MITLEELNCENENVDIDRYMNFVEYVKEDMQFPEWLGDFTKDDIEKDLKDRYKIWLYSLKDELICSVMAIKSTNDDLDYYGIDHTDEHFIEYGPMLVNPLYTGNKLQFQMIKKLDLYSLSLNYNYAFCIVHPDNIYSIENIEKSNFIFKKTKNFDEGLRNIYIKELKKET